MPLDQSESLLNQLDSLDASDTKHIGFALFHLLYVALVTKPGAFWENEVSENFDELYLSAVSNGSFNTNFFIIIILFFVGIIMLVSDYSAILVVTLSVPYLFGSF